MENVYPLRERTIVLAGPMNSTTQTLVVHLCGQGADMALVHEEAQQADRFCQQITDQREINPKHGRAMTVKANLNSLTEIKDAVGKVAHTFGGIDILIDAQMVTAPAPFDFESKELNFESLIDQHLKSSLWLTQNVLGYLKSRKKGRIVYLISETSVNGVIEDAMAGVVRGGLVPFAQSLAKQVQEHNITVNVLKLALCEEYLLGHFPGKTVKEALQAFQQTHPKARITEPERLANSVIYLLTAAGAAVNGQALTIS